jgi:hypothetical protein
MHTILNFIKPRQGWPDNSPGSAACRAGASSEGGKNERHPGNQTKKNTFPPMPPVPRDLINTLLQQGAHHPHGTFPLLHHGGEGQGEGALSRAKEVVNARTQLEDTISMRKMRIRSRDTYAESSPTTHGPINHYGPKPVAHSTNSALGGAAPLLFRTFPAPPTQTV